MMKVTQQYVMQCINNERLSREAHRKEGSKKSWEEVLRCIQETDYALKRYDGKVRINKGSRL
jgi:hypothetical protein